MSKRKTEMPVQDASVRINNFDEVATGYTAELAVNEAARCLHCKNMPCVAGCPVNVNIPEFIQAIGKKEFSKAYDSITQTNALPAICGRVCPQETQCEALCVRAKKGESVAIGRLERFAADWFLENNKQKENAPSLKPSDAAPRVAVVGSGPAGLTCAGVLTKNGVRVTVFEALHKVGGVLMYGIPEFRLPKSIVEAETASIEKLGAEIQLNMIIGRSLTIDELFDEGYKAVFIGTGAGLPVFMGIPGENLLGVYSANEFLTRVNLMKAYRNEYDTPIQKSKVTAVVGGGNVAMDAARSAKRLGAETVYLIYRRSEAEMPARLEEVHHAKEEGIVFKTLTNPTRVIGDENGLVHALECVEMDLGEPDDSGRRRPVTRQGSEFQIAVDSVIIAIGTSPNPLIRDTTPRLQTNRWGLILTDDRMQTSMDGVYAGGDVVTGAATVISAMGAGKTAAEAILTHIRQSAQIH
jgi:glutamate synthase (NADPH/NADH) small chain